MDLFLVSPMVSVLPKNEIFEGNSSFQKKSHLNTTAQEQGTESGRYSKIAVIKSVDASQICGCGNILPCWEANKPGNDIKYRLNNN